MSFNTIKVNNTDTNYTHSIFDISDYNSGAIYDNLSAALAVVPQEKQKGGMTVKFIQQIPARYSVVKTENLETEPTGTLLSEAPYIESGTYDENQLSTIFSTLPSETGAWNALTYYVAVTVDETTTYISWVITKVQNSDNKYVQYRLMNSSWSSNVLDWCNEVDTIGILKNEYNNGSIALNLIPKCYIDVNGEPQPISNFYATDFIEVLGSRLKIYSPIAQYGKFSSFYNANKEQISNFTLRRGENIIDVPSDATYVRITIEDVAVSRTYIYSDQMILTQDSKRIGFDVLSFVAGYYNLTDGNPTSAGSTRYYRSQIIPCSDWRKLKGIEQLTESADYFALWLDGIYVGYELAANGETSLTYNQVACAFKQNISTEPQREITIYTNPFSNTLKPQSRYDNLKDKKIGFLGDSITYGVGASSRTKTSYVALMKNEFNTVINYGISSTYIEEMPGRNDAMCDRYINMSDDLDIVVVYGGTNDWYYGQGWGSIDSTDKETFLGSLNVLMSGLVQKYCGKEIFFVTPMSSDFNGYNTDNPNPNTGKTMLDYRNVIIERAAYHGIPVIDLYGMCGMDVAHNAANKTYYSSDGVHPNDAGHKRVHDRIITFISNILY